MEILLKLLVSYLLGSISGSLIMGKLKDVDIRKMGSGNAGGTNAYRTMGAKFALGVVLIDVLKGFVAVKYLPLFNFGGIFTPYNLGIDMLGIVCGTGIVIGHVYPIYHGFKGGKGAGTMVGVLLALFPQGLLMCVIVWGLALVLSGYVGLSTILAGITLPITASIYYGSGLTSVFGWFSILIAIFIIFTHRSNIKRMISGNENRFEKAMFFKKRRD